MVDRPTLKLVLSLPAPCRLSHSPASCPARKTVNSAAGPSSPPAQPIVSASGPARGCWSVSDRLQLIADFHIPSTFSVRSVDVKKEIFEVNREGSNAHSKSDNWGLYALLKDQ